MAIKQDVYFAIDEEAPPDGGPKGATGAGTLDEPYRGPSSSPVWFDRILAADSSKPYFVPPNNTLRLGPGLFLTAGSNHSTEKWSVRSGWRLLGAGVSATTLKLVNVPANEHRAAVGMNYSMPGLDGFEASDFTIDCGYPGASAPVNSANTAVAVHGNHILLRRLRVINYGTNRTGVRVGVINGGTRGTNDAVIDQCTVEPGSTGAGPTGTPSSLVLVLFSGQAANPNRGCVVRNCVLRGPGAATSGADNPVHGICPGAATGFIAEGNQMFDLFSGVYDVDLQTANPVVANETTGDVVIRHNYLRNVFMGINYSRSWPVNRLIVHDNIIDVARRPLTPGGILPVGVKLEWAVVNPNRYASVVIRENLVRSAKWETGQPESIQGFFLNQVTDLNVENNLINNATTGMTGNCIVLGASVTNSRMTNNRTSAGVAVRPET